MPCLFSLLLTCQTWLTRLSLANSWKLVWKKKTKWKKFYVLRATPIYRKKKYIIRIICIFSRVRCMPPSKAEHLSVNIFFESKTLFYLKTVKEIFLLLFKKQTNSTKKNGYFSIPCVSKQNICLYFLHTVFWN